jgi:hypothetical protein
MTTPTSLAASLVVAISLALPAVATGQAVPRGGSRESSRSEPTSSPSSPAPARVRTASPSSQPAPAPATRSVSRTRGTSGTSASAVSAPSLNPTARSRGVVAGTARPRPPYTGTSTNYYYPSSHLGYAGYYSGGYYPGYYAWPSYGFHVSVGLGFGYGYGYSPYGYAPYYGLYPYAPFYYGYNPYYYPAYGYGVSTSYQSSGSYGGNRDDSDRTEIQTEIQTPTGSLRVRATPISAKVYIDGALAGRVDDFDGLSDHLKVEAGTHELELRADGYQPYSVHVTIDAGKTRTERATLKKN